MEEEMARTCSICSWVSTVSFVLFAAVAATAQTARVAVLEFREVPGAVTLGPGFEGVVWETERTKNLGAVLSTALAKSGKFHVIERAQLSKVNAERVFAELTTGHLGGGFGGAEYVILGELVRLDAYVKQSPIPYTTRIRYQGVGNLSLLLRFVSVGSGKVLTAQHVTADLVLDNLGSPQRFLDALQNAAVEKAVTYLLEAAYPAKITNVVGDIVFINRGEGGGFALGDTLNICHLGSPIRDPDTGKVLGQTETVVGEVEVIEIQPKFTKAKILTQTGEQAIKAGMICRPQQVLPKAEPPRPVKPGSSEAPIQWE